MVRSLPALAVVAVISVLLGWRPGSAGGAVVPESVGGAVQDPVGSGVGAAAGSHSFYFTRAIYPGNRGWWGRPSWTTDYPKADRQFLVVLRRVTNLDAYPEAHAVRLDDPELRRYPFLYAVEVGHMELSDSEAVALRSYLLAGGFLMVDDFWGSGEWASFVRNIRKVFPSREIVELDPDHPVFRSYYRIDRVVQVPAVHRATGGPTWERDGRVPHVRGIFDDRGRLMVAINWNTDLGDAWEWADLAHYPLEYSTFAYQMGVNLIVYALSH